MALYNISLSFTSLLSLLLGFFVLYKNPLSRVNQTWGLACLSCAVWSFFSLLLYNSSVLSSAILYSKILNVAAAYMCVLVAHFCKEVTDSRSKDTVLKIGYANSLVITAFAFTDQFTFAEPFLRFNYFVSVKPLYHFFTAHFLFYFFYGGYLLFKSLSYLSEEKRNQIKYIIVALTAGYVGGFTTFLTAYHVPVEPFLVHFVWLYAAIISYAIAKHQLLDIKLVVRRTILYSFYVFLISILYFLGALFINEMASGRWHSYLEFFRGSQLFNLHSIPPLIGTIVFLILGFAMLFSKPKTWAKTLFAILCFETFFWQFVWFYSFYCPKEDLTYIAKIVYVTITLLPFTFYHFIVTYLGKRGERGYLALFYGVAAVLIALIPSDLYIQGNRQLNWGNFTYPGTFYFVFMGFALFSMIRGLVITWDSMRSTINDSERQNQIKYLFLGFVLYFFCTLDFLQVYGLKGYPIGTFFFLLSSGVISYAILKHHLLDIHVVIKRTLFYSILIFSVSILYFCIAFFTYKILMGHWDPQVYWAAGLESLELWFRKINKNFFTLTSFLCGLSSISLAVFALAVGKTKPQRLFMFFNVAVAAWGFGNFFAGISETSEGAILGWRFAYLGGFFISAFFNHMTQSFFKLQNKKLLAVAYLQAIIFSMAALFYPETLFSKTRLIFDIHYNAITPLMAIAIAMFLFVAGFTYKHLLEYLRLAKEADETKARYFIFGFAFGFVGGITTLLPPFGIDWIYPAGNMGIAIYAFILLYAMFRYQVLDVKIVIKKTIFYSLLTLFISTAYILVVFVLHKLFFFEGSARPTISNSIISVILIMLFLKPLELFLHRFLDKKFFKGTITEIAEQKQKLEIELERRERLKSVGILAAGMAHEIKNPITAIKTFAEYLPQKHNDPEFLDKFCKTIDRESNKITQIVKDLLLFSKPSEPNRASCDVSQLLRDVMDLLSGDILKNKITVKYDLNEEWVYVDAGQIKQAFLNIIMNAIEAMGPNGGKLTVSAFRENGFVHVSIADTGPGIPADKLPHLFDPFYTNKEGGTGLGLAVTYSIIEKNGGKIKAESRFGQGACFTAQLPVGVF